MSIFFNVGVKRRSWEKKFNFLKGWGKSEDFLLIGKNRDGIFITFLKNFFLI